MLQSGIYCIYRRPACHPNGAGIFAGLLFDSLLHPMGEAAGNRQSAAYSDFCQGSGILANGSGM